MVEARSHKPMTDEETMRKTLEQNPTLIDYFTIIGFENAQLRRLIYELKHEVSPATKTNECKLGKRRAFARQRQEFLAERYSWRAKCRI